MKYNERGEELPDDTPIEMPLKFKRPPTLQEQIKAMVRREVSISAAEQGFETFEESDDFDVEDGDELPPSNYEFKDMPADGAFRSAKQDASVLDKKENKEDSKGTVNNDRIKESQDGSREDGKDGQRVDRGVAAGDGSVSGKKGKSD